jgi:hypothetical protein
MSVVKSNWYYDNDGWKYDALSFIVTLGVLLTILAFSIFLLVTC